jgi:hypothetical protein
MQHANHKTSRTAGALALVLALAISLAGAGPLAGNSGAPGITPPGSNAFGKTLQDWLAVYWRWYYSGADETQSKVNRVQLLPLPNGEVISGDFSPENPGLLRGKLEITLPPGTPFVLPLFAWVGERYEGWPEVPDDPPIADETVLAGVHPTLTIDGKRVVSDANKADFYIRPTYFDPVVTYPEPTDYGSIAAVFFQGCGIVRTPLAVGVHTIHLYEPLIIPAGAYDPLPDGIGVIYDNTWIITVRPVK